MTVGRAVEPYREPHGPRLFISLLHCHYWRLELEATGSYRITS
jgi:hypothetical protein